MNPTHAAQLARQLMQAHRLTDWRFAFNHRKRNLGLCRYEVRTIELSIHFVMANDQAAVTDTILHEIAHALAGPNAGHGPRWKLFCQRVGAKPQRCDSEATMPHGRWRATCEHCGRHYTRHRRPLTGRRYWCRLCGPTKGRIAFRCAVPAA